MSRACVNISTENLTIFQVNNDKKEMCYYLRKSCNYMIIATEDTIISHISNDGHVISQHHYVGVF